MNEEAGRAAYTEWCRIKVAPAGITVIPFDKLPIQTQDEWILIADAAIKAFTG